jgi:hypothetical protein
MTPYVFFGTRDGSLELDGAILSADSTPLG